MLGYTNNIFSSDSVVLIPEAVFAMTVEPPGRPKLKTLYTSGAVAVTSDGTRLVTCVEEDILLK